MGRAEHKARTPADTSVAAKLKRIAKDQEEFRRKVLAKDAGEPKPKPKSKWPRRPFNKRGGGK
jgi:hypothetical protein